MSYTQPQFDVFLAHNNLDKPLVKEIARKLEQRDLKPWLDEEQIPPGRSFQDEIQQAIPVVKSAAIFIGSQGLGRWQNWELQAFISQCVENKIPVIPVFLPGVSDLPKDLFLLRQLRWIEFSTLDDEKALDLLEWGITGQKPQKNLQFNDEKPGQILQQELLEEIDVFYDKQNQNFELQNHQLSEVGADDTGQSPEAVHNFPLSEDIYSVDLRSEYDVDYTQLRNLLANKDWKQADEETLVVMLKATGREEEGTLSYESIRNFPSTDLSTIDQLWVISSSGRFGFSVQKRIWESLGGNPNADYKTWHEFCNCVKWPVREEWTNEDFAYNTLSCNGQLPVMGAETWDYKWTVFRNLFSHSNL